MGRILHIESSSRGRAARWAALLGLTALAALGGFRWLGMPDGPQPVASVDAPAPAISSIPAITESAAPATAAGTAPSATTCALQSLQLAWGKEPARTLCMAGTVVQQTGGVRTYAVRAGDAEGWSLRVDTSLRSILSVQLLARDGREYACEASQCGGTAVFVEPVGAGQGSIDLRELRLLAQGSASMPAEALLSMRLQVPVDEQMPGLACSGPSLGIASANGSARRFCAQGGVGVEFADDGQHVYRLQDHEGRTLTVAVEPDQRIASVSWEGRSCEGAACRGATTSSADPANPLAERSFYFGRTALFEPGATAGEQRAPAIVLDGTLVAPAQ